MRDVRRAHDAGGGGGTAGEGGLVRAIGTFGLAAGILNITIGGGIFRLPADVASSLGAAAPLAYLTCAVAMGLIVLAFAEAGSRVSMTGGPYAYVETAFGPFVGFICGVLLWMLGTFALAAVSTIFVANVGQLIPAVAGRPAGAVLLLGVFALLAWVNIRGVRQGLRLNNAFTVAKLLPLLLLAVLGTFAIRGDNLTVLVTPTAGDVARTSLLLVFAFAGIETALVPSGEVANPARTVPRAILIAMVTITALYVWLQVVSQGVVGAELGSSATPLAEAAGRSIGHWARTLLLVGAAVSMFGYIGGMTLAVPRALFAFARDGFLPARLARVHPTFRTPHVAIAVQAAITCLLAISGRFEWLAILANLSTLVLYGACCVAAFVLRRRGVSQGGTPFRVPGGGLLPWLACAVIAWMLTSIRATEWLALAVVLLTASALYLRANRSRAVRAPVSA
jgi:amino acid transporter